MWCIIMKKTINNSNMEIKENWKKTAKQYLIELERFLDLADNIADKDFKERIIGQMLRVDNELTKEAEKIFEKLKTEIKTEN